MTVADIHTQFTHIRDQAQKEAQMADMALNAIEALLQENQKLKEECEQLEEAVEVACDRAEQPVEVSQ